MAKTKLVWDRNTEPDMDHYNVYLNGMKQGQVAQPPEGTSPEWVLLPNMAAGNLTVTAVDQSGNESAMSVPVPFVDITAPNIPSNPRLE